MSVREYVCVYACVSLSIRESDLLRICVSVYKRVWVRESLWLCIYEFMYEKSVPMRMCISTWVYLSMSVSACVYAYECRIMCFSVCVCERKSTSVFVCICVCEYERDYAVVSKGCVCLWGCVYVYKYVFVSECASLWELMRAHAHKISDFVRLAEIKYSQTEQSIYIFLSVYDCCNESHLSVTSQRKNSSSVCICSTENPWKLRFYHQDMTLANIKYRKGTALSNYMWQLKNSLNGV